MEQGQWKIWDDGSTSTIGEVLPNCNNCSFNPFRDEPDDDLYTLEDGEPINS